MIPQQNRSRSPMDSCQYPPVHAIDNCVLLNFNFITCLDIQTGRRSRRKEISAGRFRTELAHGTTFKQRKRPHTSIYTPPHVIPDNPCKNTGHHSKSVYLSLHYTTPHAFVMQKHTCNPGTYLDVQCLKFHAPSVCETDVSVAWFQPLQEQDR